MSASLLASPLLASAVAPPPTLQFIDQSSVHRERVDIHTAPSHFCALQQHRHKLLQHSVPFSAFTALLAAIADSGVLAEGRHQLQHWQNKMLAAQVRIFTSNYHHQHPPNRHYTPTGPRLIPVRTCMALLALAGFAPAGCHTPTFP